MDRNQEPRMWVERDHQTNRCHPIMIEAQSKAFRNMFVDILISKDCGIILVAVRTLYFYFYVSVKIFGFIILIKAKRHMLKFLWDNWSSKNISSV